MKVNPGCEYLAFPVELKFVGAAEKGIIQGYASVFDREHESGDFVEPGAFRKTIAERVSKGLVPYFDTHQWDCAHTLGTVSRAAEDSRGLEFEAQLSSAPSVQDFRVKVAEGHITRNSIGFLPVLEKWSRHDDGKTHRHLQELKLFEISAVPIADDPHAVIIGIKAVVPYQDLPLGRARAWDAAAAEGRVREWAGGTETNWTRYRRAFLWYDREKPDELGSYKFPIADVVDGELTAIPRGIFAAAGVIQGARGGASIPGSDVAGVRAHLTRYYEKMRREFNDESIKPPWEMSALAQALLDRTGLQAYSYDEIAVAAREMLAAMSTSDRKRLIAELSAGPGSPPTDDDASGRSLRQKLLEASKLRSDITRRRVQWN